MIKKIALLLNDCHKAVKSNKYPWLSALLNAEKLKHLERSVRLKIVDLGNDKSFLKKNFGMKKWLEIFLPHYTVKHCLEVGSKQLKRDTLHTF